MSSQKYGASENAGWQLVGSHLDTGRIKVKKRGASLKGAFVISLDVRKAWKENALRCRVLK